jgi:hypothetical protein
MRYWWVSHNQTFDHEVFGGFLWSPVTKANGQSNYFYDTMEQAQPGDLVFSFARSHVQAIGIIKRGAVVTPNRISKEQDPTGTTRDGSSRLNLKF